MRLLTDNEVIAAFGDPTKYLGADGAPDPMWRAAVLSGFALPARLPLSWDRTKFAKVITCHRDVVLELRRIFQAIYANPEAWASIGDYGGCYQWRTNRNNPKKRSRHCWGIAVDIDVADNPNGDSTPEVHPHIISCFAAEGWVWGGDPKLFPTRDAMHFERGHE